MMDEVAVLIPCYNEPAIYLSRGKSKIFLKSMHKNTNLSVTVKGKTSMLRMPLTNAAKFVLSNQGLKENYEVILHSSD